MAELKERPGLCRALCSGWANVQTEALGANIASNTKRLVARNVLRLHVPAQRAQRLEAGAIGPCRATRHRQQRPIARTHHDGRLRLLVTRNPQNTARYSPSATSSLERIRELGG